MARGLIESWIVDDTELRSSQVLVSGTLTFLFTDIEDSTRIWEQYPEQMRIAMARHDALIESAVEGQYGLLIRPRGEGDSRFAVFPQADDGIRSAIDILQKLAGGFSDLPMALKVRIGMHTGTADLRLGDYYGSTVNRCARIRALGHGGQLLFVGLGRYRCPDNLAAAHDGNAVGHRQHFLELVGDEDDRYASLRQFAHDAE